MAFNTILAKLTGVESTIFDVMYKTIEAKRTTQYTTIVIRLIIL